MMPGLIKTAWELITIKGSGIFENQRNNNKTRTYTHPRWYCHTCHAKSLCVVLVLNVSALTDNHGKTARKPDWGRASEITIAAHMECNNPARVAHATWPDRGPRLPIRT